MAERLKQDKEKQSLTKERKRGVLLTILLWFSIIIDLENIPGSLWLGIASNTGQLHHMQGLLRYHSWTETIVSMLESILLLICNIAILKWKKWGVYGICAISIIFPLLYMYMGTQFAPIFQVVGHITPIIFLLLILRVWKYFT
jgi:hypothetical protein